MNTEYCKPGGIKPVEVRDQPQSEQEIPDQNKFYELPILFDHCLKTFPGKLLKDTIAQRYDFSVTVQISSHNMILI